MRSAGVVDAIETGSPESELARDIKHTQLQNSLSDADVQWLERPAVGPGAWKALFELAQRSAALPAPAEDVADQRKPTETQVAALLDRARR